MLLVNLTAEAAKFAEETLENSALGRARLGVLCGEQMAQLT
jgi:hypothetical protein